MKKLLSFVAPAVSCVVLCAALVQPAFSNSMYGAGPHGFDWAIGTWSCTNDMPSPMGGPSKQTLTVTRASGGALMYHAVGESFDNTWYNIYVPSTKSWVSPFIVSNGAYGSESTAQSGTKIVWIGTAFDPGGKMIHVRDTNTVSPTKYSDLGEYQSGGSWKEQYRVTCLKS
jgi:hypothetical protein